MVSPLREAKEEHERPRVAFAPADQLKAARWFIETVYITRTYQEHLHTIGLDVESGLLPQERRRHLHRTDQIEVLRPCPSKAPGRQAKVSTEEHGSGGPLYSYRGTKGGDQFYKDVAIKFLHKGTALPIVLERFRDEARILGLLRDRAIVVVDPPTRLGGQWAVVMEFVDVASCCKWECSHQGSRCLSWARYAAHWTRRGTCPASTRSPST